MGHLCRYEVELLARWRCTPISSLNFYEETKMQAHEIATTLQKQGAPIIITCPAGVIGPGDYSTIGYLVRMYVHHCLPPILWTPTGKLAHVYVVVATEGIAPFVEHRKIGETYLLRNLVLVT